MKTVKSLKPYYKDRTLNRLANTVFGGPVFAERTMLAMIDTCRDEQEFIEMIQRATNAKSDKQQPKENKNKAVPFFSAWQDVGAGVEKIIANSVEPRLNDSQICAIMHLAIEPEILSIALKDANVRPLADAYASALTSNPDLTLKIFQFVRSKWHDAYPSYAARVEKYVSTHPKVLLDGLTDRAIGGEVGFREEEIPNVKKARQRHKRPKVPMLSIATELNSAIKHLRKLGFCQHW